MIQTYLKESDVNGQKVFKTYVALSSLRPDPQNPRDISDEKMSDLITFLQKYETLEPLLVDFRPEKEGQLIGGNKRFEAYGKMGITEAWIEPRIPASDAQAFEMATLHNMEFGNYMEVKLKEEIRKHAVELGDDLEKLAANLKLPQTFDDLMKPARNPKAKYEIVIRCVDENDMNDKFKRLLDVGITAKKK